MQRKSLGCIKSQGDHLPRVFYTHATGSHRRWMKEPHVAREPRVANPWPSWFCQHPPLRPKNEDYVIIFSLSCHFSLNAFLSSVEHKRRYLKSKTGCSFPCLYNKENQYSVILSIKNFIGLNLIYTKLIWDEQWRSCLLQSCFIVKWGLLINLHLQLKWFFFSYSNWWIF